MKSLYTLFDLCAVISHVYAISFMPKRHFNASCSPRMSLRALVEQILFQVFTIHFNTSRVLTSTLRHTKYMRTCVGTYTILYDFIRLLCERTKVIYPILSYPIQSNSIPFETHRQPFHLTQPTRLYRKV